MEAFPQLKGSLGAGLGRMGIAVMLRTVAILNVAEFFVSDGENELNLRIVLAVLFEAGQGLKRSLCDQDSRFGGARQFGNQGVNIEQ